ncbi:MAG: sulfatase, partial [Armatimonadota bacterium]
DVSRTDAEVGRLMQALDDQELTDDTLVVIISDHGEPFGEHGTIRKFGVPVYDELARMVFLMKGPGVPEGERSSALVQNVDLAPTLLDMLGLPAPEGQKLAGLPPMSDRGSLDGLSLVPLLEHQAQSVRDTAYIGGFGLRGGIVTEREKLIDNRGERRTELFDLAADPKEQHNLIDDRGDRAEQLHRQLWEFCSLWARALSWRDRPAAGR